jgi:predicted aldo/keto reductase-like oxidoreductase
MRNDKKISRRDLLKIGAASGAAAVVGGGIGVHLARAAGEDGETVLPQVPRRVLGKTGQTVPILLFGAGVKLDQRFDPKLAEAVRFGVNYFDAADCYGGSTCETAIGNFWTRAKMKREDLWITSKSDKHDPEGLEQTLDIGLEALQTDYIDMYYLHALKDEKWLSDEMGKKSEALKKAGKIRHFGFSCHDGNVAELLTRAAELPWIDSIMFRYNFREYGNEKLNKAIDAAHKANIGLIAMKTQGSEASFKDAWKEFEKTGKWTKHQAVLKAVWADTRITAAVSHMDTFEKLKENIAAAVDMHDLGQAEWDAITRYAAATRSHACDGCDHLCGAAVREPVAIGATMRFLMYHDVYGEADKARQLFGELPEPARRLRDVDFAGANRACPHGIDVAAHMQRAVDLFEA